MKRMNRELFRVIYFLAYNSYKIISVFFYVVFFIVVAIYVIRGKITPWIAYSYWSTIGLYIGYNIAYYAIRFLHKNLKE